MPIQYYSSDDVVEVNQDFYTEILIGAGSFALIAGLIFFIYMWVVFLRK